MTIHSDISASSNTPVVALHSSASSKSQWKTLSKLLQGRNHVVAYDLAGYGSAPNRPQTSVGMAAIADPIIQAIEALGQPVHLVGHSFGGAVAIRIALLRPDLIKSMILYEPASFHILKEGDSHDQQALSEIQNVKETLISAVADGRRDIGMQSFVEFWNHQEAWSEMSNDHRDKLTSMSLVVINDFHSATSETWSIEDLAEISVPTLMLMGMESPAVSQRAAAMVTRNLPQAELAMLPGLGHMAPIQSPEWVNPRIQQYIARIEKSASPISWPAKMAA